MEYISLLLQFVSVYFFIFICMYLANKLKKDGIKKLSFINIFIVTILAIIEIILLLTVKDIKYVIVQTIYHQILILIGVFQCLSMIYLFIISNIKKALK